MNQQTDSWNCADFVVEEGKESEAKLYISPETQKWIEQQRQQKNQRPPRTGHAAGLAVICTSTSARSDTIASSLLGEVIRGDCFAPV